MKISRQSFIKKYKKLKNCNTHTALIKWQKILTRFGSKQNSVDELRFGNVVINQQDNQNALPFIIARNGVNGEKYKLSYIKVRNLQNSDPNPGVDEYFFIKKYVGGFGNPPNLPRTAYVTENTQEYNNLINSNAFTLLLFNHNPANYWNTAGHIDLPFFHDFFHSCNQDSGFPLNTRRQIGCDVYAPRYVLANNVLDHEYLSHFGIHDLRSHLLRAGNLGGCLQKLEAFDVDVNNQPTDIEAKVTYKSCLDNNNQKVSEYNGPIPNQNALRNAFLNRNLRACQLYINFRDTNNPQIQHFHLSLKSDELNTQPFINGQQRSTRGYEDAPHFYHLKLERINRNDVSYKNFYWYLVFDVVQQKFKFLPTRSVPTNPVTNVNAQDGNYRNIPDADKVKVQDLLQCIENFFNAYLHKSRTVNNVRYYAVQRQTVNGVTYSANDPWGYFTISPQDINDINNAVNVITF